MTRARGRAFKASACPDCGAAVLPDTGVDHDPTCPLWLALERRRSQDRTYFELHPQRRFLHRTLTAAELQTLALAGLHYPPGTPVTVEAAGPGVRLLHYGRAA